MRALTRAFFLFAILASSAAASAQPLPGVVMMDRFDEQTKFASSLTYVGLDGADDSTALRFDLFGQYMTPAGMGGYAMVPINYVSFADESETSLGNLEVGGLYLIPGDVPIVLRGGVALQTADGDNFSANFVGLLARFNDFPSATSEVTWGRLSATPMVRRGTTFFKADLGVDIPIAEEDGVDADPLIRVNAGGGVETGQIALIGELVSVISTESDLDNRMVNFFGITGRYMGSGPLQPSLSVQLPFDEEFGRLIDWNIILGLEYVVGASDVSAPASDPPPPGY